MYFVPPENMPDVESRLLFKRWIAFDSFVMQTNGADFFDRRMNSFEEVVTKVEEGEIGDAGDLYKSVDYEHIEAHLFRRFKTDERYPSLSYDTLYEKHVTSSQEDRDLVEWLVSRPSRADIQTIDSFFSIYWEILHSVISIEYFLGDPPNCDQYSVICHKCHRQSLRHHLMSRRDWCIKRISAIYTDERRLQDVVTYIEAGRELRNKVAHSPSFDKAIGLIRPHMHTEVYGASRVKDEYKDDRVAAFALSVALSYIAHEMAINRIYGYQIHGTRSPLKSTSFGDPTATAA